jgi:flagellar assembly protein FliH
MTFAITPKFSEEELHGCKSWLLPDVSSKKTLPSAEKEAADKKKGGSAGQKKGSILSPNEKIEIIEELIEPITAEQLQQITSAAEKEGFDSGFKQGLGNGIKEGKEKGSKDGYDEGMAQSKQLVTAQCEQLQRIIDALLIPLETEQNQLHVIILNMVTELAKAVVLRELKLDSSHIIHVVDDALNAVPIGADKFSLYLNSQDISIVEKHLEYFQHTSDKRLILHVDDELLPGGCRLETQQTVVDYTVEYRLQKVMDDFLHKRFVNNNDDDFDSKNLNSLREDSNEKNITGIETVTKSKTATTTEEAVEEKNIKEQALQEELAIEAANTKNTVESLNDDDKKEDLSKRKDDIGTEKDQ